MSRKISHLLDKIMSVHYGTVTSISEVNDPIFASVEIGGTRFSIDNTRPGYTAPDVRVGDRVSYRADVHGYLLYIDVVRAAPEDHTDDDYRDGILP